MSSIRLGRWLGGCFKAGGAHADEPPADAARGPASRGPPAGTGQHRRQGREDESPEHRAVAAAHELSARLVGLQGSCLSRVASAAAVVSSGLGVEVRLYATLSSEASTSRAPRDAFVLVLSTADGGLDRGGRLPVVGQAVRPAVEAPRAAGSQAAAVSTGIVGASSYGGTTVMDNAQPSVPSDYGDSALGLAAPESLPSLLARMLEAKAPVFRAAAEPGGEGVSVALVPLSTEDGIAAALWIARRGDTAVGPAVGPDRTDATGALPCPSLLSSPSALRHLGLSLSLCLLSADGHRSMAVLAAALLSLSCAPSLQQLVAGLCEGAAETVRHRFSLSPRVVAALVPDLGSAVGLLLSTGPEWPPAGAGPSPSTSLQGLQRGASRPQTHSPGNSASSNTAPSSLTPLGPSRPLLNLAAMLAHGGVEPVPESPSAPAPIVPPGPAANRNDTPSDSANRVVPLSPRELTAAETGGLLSFTQPVQALRAKPFLLTRTVLGYLAKRLVGAAGLPTGGAAEQPGPTALAHGASSSELRAAGESSLAPVGPAALGLVIEDCAMHVQDPHRPSRDILLLLSGAGAPPTSSTMQNVFSSTEGYLSGTGAPGGTGSSTVAASGGSGRGVRSMLVLTVQAGTEARQSVLGLYVLFPQHLLPLELLREARALLLELLQLVSPLLSHRLSRHFPSELQTLMAGAPGSYAVLPSWSPSGAGHSASPGPGLARFPTSTFAESASSGPLTRPRKLPQRRPSTPVLTPGRGNDMRHRAYWSVAESGGGRGSQGGPSTSGEGPDYWYRVVQIEQVAGGAGGTPAGAGPACYSPAMGGGLAIVGSAPGSGFNVQYTTATSHCAAGAISRSTSVIHLEDLDRTGSSLHAQAPALVASLQSSIALARADAAAGITPGASSAASNERSSTSGLLVGALASGAALGAPQAQAQAQGVDVATLKLLSRIGEGGCAVVFRGRLGPSVDCAVKLMELPTDDDDTADAGWAADEAGPLELAPSSRDRAGGGPSPGPGRAQQQPGSQRRSVLAEGYGLAWAATLQTAATKRGLAARRVLLRNAMELAALTTLGGHPNIMQVYGVLSNVTLSRRSLPDGNHELKLTQLDEQIDYQDPNAPPVCAAVVSEWCDLGSLENALISRTFPALARPHPDPAAGGAADPAGGGRSSTGGSAGGGRVISYKVILMTLLDVALALRHLHAHNLIHRDVKSANVFLRSCATDPRGFTAKLGDFGFVAILSQPGDEQTRGEPYALADDSCGTVTHMAPEAFDKTARLGASCDIFSFGILMYEMTSGGCRPYLEAATNQISLLVRRGVRPSFNETVPAAYRRLAESCWSADPSRRPRAGDLVAALSHMMTYRPTRTEPPR